jgi:hypothetical protein
LIVLLLAPGAGGMNETVKVQDAPVAMLTDWHPLTEKSEAFPPADETDDTSSVPAPVLLIVTRVGEDEPTSRFPKSMEVGLMLMVGAGLTTSFRVVLVDASELVSPPYAATI